MRVVSKQEMIDLDERMIHKYNISLESMMERAGEALAELSLKLYPNANRFLILAGSGNNSGGGLVASRFLVEKGKNVRIVLSSQDIKNVPQKQLEKLQEVNTDILYSYSNSLFKDIDVVIDALLGYSIEGKAKGTIAQLIRQLNHVSIPTISLDVPSGLDPDEGVLYPKQTVKANATLAIAYPKAGLLKNNAKKYVGEIYVADIGVPSKWYKENNIKFSFNNNKFKKYESSI